MPMPSFLLPPRARPGDHGPSTPESVSRRRLLAEGLMAQGMDTSPIASPWQGAARMAQALAGGYGMRNADQAETQGREAARQRMVALLGGSGGMDLAALAEYASRP
jgi:hypothetical protein